MPVFSVQSLSKNYGSKTALNQFSAEISAGECLGIFGPNGAGKSTFVNIICGLLRPDSGTITFKGKDILAKDFRWNSSLGMVLEYEDVFQYLSIRDHILFCAELHNVDKKEAERRTDELLEFTALKEKQHILVSECSQGMKKKTAICSSIIHGPELLILDESFNGLDTVSSAGLRMLFKSRKKTAIIMTSHSLHEAEEMIDKAIIIYQGNKRDELLIEQIRSQYSTLEHFYLHHTNAEDRKIGFTTWL